MKVLTLWCREVNDIAIALEHVDLLNRLNGLHIQLLQCSLKLLVVGARGLVDLLNLSPWSAFASVIAYQCLVQISYISRRCSYELVGLRDASLHESIV